MCLYYFTLFFSSSQQYSDDQRQPKSPGWHLSLPCTDFDPYLTPVPSPTSSRASSPRKSVEDIPFIGNSLSVCFANQVCPWKMSFFDKYVYSW